MEKKFRNIYKYKNLIFVIFSILSVCFISEIAFWVQNYTSEDTKIYLTSGHMMHSNLIPYHDFYEQKGILWQFLFYIITWFGQDKLVLTIIEIILLYCFINIFEKIRKLIAPNLNFWLSTLLAILIYFLNGKTILPEKYCEILFLYTLYILLDFKNSTKKQHNIRLILMSIFSTFLLLSKFTLVAFLLPWYIYLLIIRIKNKEFKTLFMDILISLISPLIIFGLLLIYFLKTNSFNDFINVYLNWSLKYYKNSAFSTNNIGLYLSSVFKNIISIYFSSTPLFFGFIISLLVLIWTKTLDLIKKIALFVSLFISFILIFGTGPIIAYYAIVYKPLFVFLLISICSLNNKVLWKFKKLKLNQLNYIWILLLLLLLPLTRNSQIWLTQEDTNSKKITVYNTYCKQISEEQKKQNLTKINDTLFINVNLFNEYINCNSTPLVYWYHSPNFTDKQKRKEISKIRENYIKDKKFRNVIFSPDPNLKPELEIQRFTKIALENGYIIKSNQIKTAIWFIKK